MNEKELQKRLDESIAFIRKRTSVAPQIALILGSGLGDFAETIEIETRIPTTEIPHFPRSTVEGHKGYLVFGYLEGVPLMIVQGRTHYYEGHPIQDVGYVVRVMAEVGIKVLLVTNAAGGVNPRFKPGDLMVIVDHINFLFNNPLIGPSIPEEARWPDMYNCYDENFVELIEQVGLDLKIPLRKGVLFVSSGPSYETASEVRMVQRFGGDAVSMSTVPEVLIARARGIRVAGISCITNLATGISTQPLSHKEVTEIANQVKDKFQKLVREVVLRIGKQI